MLGVSLCITFRSQTCGKVGITNLEIAEITPTGRLILVMDVLKDGLDSEYTYIYILYLNMMCGYFA